MATQQHFNGSGGGSERNGSASVLEGVEYKSNSFFVSVWNGWLEGRGLLLPSFAPPLHQSIFTHTHKNTHRFSQLQWSME